jgi:hypothetical protein
MRRSQCQIACGARAGVFSRMMPRGSEVSWRRSDIDRPHLVLQVQCKGGRDRRGAARYRVAVLRESLPVDPAGTYLLPARTTAGAPMKGQTVTAR